VRSLLKNYESLNAILAMYWCSLPLRNYGNSVNSNLYPHAEVPSAIYTQAVEVFKDYDALTGHKPLDNSKVYSVYCSLLGVKLLLPKIQAKNQHMNFDKMWKEFN
jgi:hypothetical protein